MIIERENGTILEIGQPVIYVSMDLNEPYTDHYGVITDIDEQVTVKLICDRQGKATEGTLTRPNTWVHPVSKFQLEEARDMVAVYGSEILKEVIRLVEMYNVDRQARQRELFEEEND